MQRASLIAAVACLACLTLASNGDAASGGGWRDLQEGSAGSYRWTVAAAGGATADPCLRVAIVDRHGPLSLDRARFRDCGTPRRRAPLIVGGSESRAKGGGMTVLAVAMPPGVVRLRVGFAGGPPETARLRPRRVAGWQLGIGAIAVPGRRCATELFAEGAGRVPLWRIETQSGACDS